MKIIETAKQSFAKAYVAIDHEKERSKQKEESYHREAVNYTETAALEKWQQLVKEYQDNITAISKELKESLEKCKNDYEKEVHNFYLPKGEELDENDVKILNSGLLLRPEEVVELIVKHCDNITMIRLLDKYVNDTKIEVPAIAKTGFLKARKAGEIEKDAFNVFCQLASHAVTMALDSNEKTVAYIKSADSLEEYAKAAEMKIESARVYIDEATKQKLLEYQEEQAQKRNQVRVENPLDFIH